MPDLCNQLSKSKVTWFDKVEPVKVLLVDDNILEHQVAKRDGMVIGLHVRKGALNNGHFSILKF